jgi:hypothetical protein
MDDRTRAPVRREHLPDLVIAGVTKAGTTSLFWWLSQHPDVCGSDVKEVRYFSAIRHGRPLPPLERYAAHFGHRGDEQYAMEASPAYAYGGRPLAETIARVLDDPHILICLREPVERFVSFHAFMRSRLAIPRTMTLADYLERCREMRETGEDRQRENFPYYALSTGYYDEYIPDWFDVFGDRLRIVFFDDLVGRPRATLEAIVTWLGLDPAPVAGFDLTPENRTVPVRSAAAQRAALATNRRLRRFFGRHRSLKRNLRAAYLAANADRRSRPDTNTSREDLEVLRLLYRASTDHLGRLLVEQGYEQLPAWLSIGTPVHGGVRG